jgi:hypothetical protein
LWISCFDGCPFIPFLAASVAGQPPELRPGGGCSRCCAGPRFGMLMGRSRHHVTTQMSSFVVARVLYSFYTIALTTCNLCTPTKHVRMHTCLCLCACATAIVADPGPVLPRFPFPFWAPPLPSFRLGPWPFRSSVGWVGLHSPPCGLPVVGHHHGCRRDKKGAHFRW